MLPDKPFDVIVVGTGATGGWCAKELCESGLRVLSLEAGPELVPGSLAVESKAAVNPPKAQPIQSQHSAWTEANAHLFVDDQENPYAIVSDERPFRWIRGRQVGGRTLLWGRICLRISDVEFLAHATDGAGGLWPITYSELSPFYDEVEDFFGLKGAQDGVPHAPNPRRHDPVELSEAERWFKARVENRWPTRAVVSGRGIPISKKHDADWPTHTSQGSTLASAKQTGNWTLCANQIVSRVVLDERGRACGVTAIHRETKETREFSAPIVILAASTFETVRLLLLSASEKQPTGLGNRHDLVGRYIMDHPAVRILGYAPHLSGECELPPGGPNLVYMPKFRNVSEPSGDFVRGYQIVGGIQRLGLKGVVPGYISSTMIGASPAQTHGTPASGAPFVLSAVCEHLPYFENRAMLDPSIVDRWGIPVLQIDAAPGGNEERMLEDAERTLMEIAKECEFVVTATANSRVLGDMIHEVGGARMGSSPDESVVNRDHEVWDVPNLYVVDGACWPSLPHQNPTLTMMALALRCARQIARKG